MLQVKNLKKSFFIAEGKVEAIRDVSFEVAEGILTLLGPSGCGKTTTLRCVAGLETPDEGEIYIGGQAVYLGNQRTIVPAYRRGIGMVFQSYAIWPHMTVFDNVAFPLVRGRVKVSRARIREKVGKALQLVGLEGLENRPAPLLSGGQQQRVSLARALVYEPQLLLLDEPLSNLDAKLREEMRLELRDLITRLKISALYVTHDQEEALVLSDRVAVMCNGEILQESNPREMYLRPQHPFVANFIGNANFVEGQVEQGSKDGMTLVETPLGQLVCSLRQDIGFGKRVSVVFRPEDVLVHTDSYSQNPNIFQGIIERLIFVGNKIQCEIRVGTSLIHGDISLHLEVQAGEQISFEIPPERIWILPVV